MSYQRLIKTTVESTMSILLMFLFSIKSGMIWGFIFGYFISSFTMLYINYKSFKKSKLNPSINKVKVLAKRYMNFPKYNMPHALLNTVSSNAPIFLIPIFYGNTTLGLYAFGLKIIQAPLTLISSSIFNVLGQKIAEEHSKGNEIRSIFIYILKKLSFVAILLIPFFIYIDDIFAYIFGSEWRIAGEYVQILSPWILFVFIVSPFATIPHIYNEQKKAFVLEIMYSLVRILPFIIGAGLFNLELKSVLIIYTISAIILLTYGFNWYYSLINLKGEKVI